MRLEVFVTVRRREGMRRGTDAARITPSNPCHGVHPDKSRLIGPYRNRSLVRRRNAHGEY